jgi:MFS family permease
MREVLGFKTMRRLWYAQIVSNLGDFLALYAVISVLTFQLHATPEQVTGVQISYLLPIAVLGILAGVFVDRWPLKPTLVASDLTRAGLVLLLMLAHRAMGFYAVLAAISVVSSFFGPAQGVAIRSAVPLHGLRPANSLMQQVMFGMRIVGPGLAGVLVAAFGPRSCYLADAASFVASGCLIASLTITRGDTKMVVPAQTADETGPKPSGQSGLAAIWPDMKQGIGFLAHHAGLLFVILALTAGMFVIGCFGPLIAVYIRDTLHAASWTFAVVAPMIGVGMFLGVNVLNAKGKHLKDTTLVYSGLGGMAVGIAMLAALPFVWSSILGNLIIGVSVAGIVIPANVMIQQETPAALMGRVGSTVMSLVFTAQILGLVLSGQLAQAIGVRHVFAVCAALLVVLIGAGKFFMEPKPVGAGTVA